MGGNLALILLYILMACTQTILALHLIYELTICFNILKVYVLITQCPYGFHVVLRIKRIYFINHHLQTYLCN